MLYRVAWEQALTPFDGDLATGVQNRWPFPQEFTDLGPYRGAAIHRFWLGEAVEAIEAELAGHKGLELGLAVPVDVTGFDGVQRDATAAQRVVLWSRSRTIGDARGIEPGQRIASSSLKPQTDRL